MDEAKTLPRAPALALVRNRLAAGAALACLLLAVLVFLAVPFLAGDWLRTPFLGGFYGSTLVFNGVDAASREGWGAYEKLSPGDRLIQVARRPVSSAADIQRVLRDYSPGESLPVTVRSASGYLATYHLALQPFPGRDRLAYLFAPVFIGLVHLGAGLWVLRLRREDPAGPAFAVLAASIAILAGGLFDAFTTHRLIYLWSGALALSGGALLHLALVFPREARLVRRFSALQAAPYLPSLALMAYTWPRLFDLVHPLAYRPAWRAALAYAALGAAALVFGGAVRRFTSQSPVAREQMRAVLWAAPFAFGPPALWLAGNMLGWRLGALPAVYFLWPLAAFPLAVAFALLRYRLVNTDYVLSRVALYSLLTVLGAAAYALMVSGLSLIFGDFLPENPFLVGALVFALALLLNPLRTRLQAVVDGLFFRGERAYRQQLESFSQELAPIVELPAIVAFLRSYVEQHLEPRRLHIFVHDPLTGFYLAAEGEDGKATTDIRFPTGSGLARSLSRGQGSLFLDPDDSFPLPLRAEKARLALLGAQLFVALPGQQQLAGWLALGPRRSGESYSTQDLSFLTALAEQAARAIERAQVLADKDRRVHEMNVLSRVAQGVNITLDFDDILELIYAQTSQVLPATDFAVTLYNRPMQSLRHAFYVESDERLREREDRFMPEGQGLEAEVLHGRRTVMTDDYERECRNRQTLPAKQGVFAWMGAPLNAGAETIGVISVGSRDPAVVYTDEQHSILQAVADQAAGAIVKARLLETSERRARQLTTLNEVARSLTSTLEIDPLLNRILESAVEMLDCEAGSLLLADEDTGELVFEAAVGSVADELIGKRLAPGVGLVGKAMETRQPEIVNNVEQSKEWYDKADKQTGFVTRGLLVVPMMVKERVLGVIEVINKRDGMPFDSDDQELLKAFTGQAAIAVENARLYTLTDQALASRVEELSVMQRIDRELNASLDVGRAMRITLDWAMRQSDSAAGLIGVVEEGGLRVTAAEGYTIELAAYEKTPLPLELPALQEAVASGQIQHLNAAQRVSGGTILTGAKSQLVIPIRREAEVIGLMLLESPNPERYGQEVQEFLIRLSDHAAIAISNAQLYGAVQQANVAKSEFVSFVSHELKTPMTSIKGYADLLAAGAVGEVSEAQSNFLSTIRSNVSRMATLVSDLADISRIEAGRLHLEFGAVAPGEVVEEVVRSTGGLFDEKEQRLSLEIPDDLPPVWGDRNRLVQVLTNLVSNAHKYTPEGGQITIRAELSANRWDPEGAPEVVHLAVEDNGIGIKKEDQEKIFQQYFRTEEGKEAAAGTGLGLNITRYLVAMQGGKIWFESRYRKGTTFHFTAPVAELEAIESPPDSPANRLLHESSTAEADGD